jgi:hypothetical protein
MTMAMPMWMPTYRPFCGRKEEEEGGGGRRRRKERMAIRDKAEGGTRSKRASEKKKKDPMTTCDDTPRQRTLYRTRCSRTPKGFTRIDEQLITLSGSRGTNAISIQPSDSILGLDLR